MVPKPVGTDTVEAGSTGTLVLVSSRDKGWAPRHRVSSRSHDHPGTAVSWEGTLWEVLAAERESGAVRYRLGAWDEQHAVRVRAVYDEATEKLHHFDSDVEARNVRRRKWVNAFAPLTGLLPGTVLTRWEMEIGVNAPRLVIISTLVPFLVGAFSMMSFLLEMLGGTALPGAHAPLIWFFPESVFRFGIAMSQGKPVGSVVGSVVWFIWRGLRGGK
jgi:hypothetical protein